MAKEICRIAGKELIVLRDERLVFLQTGRDHEESHSLQDFPIEFEKRAKGLAVTHP